MTTTTIIVSINERINTHSRISLIAPSSNSFVPFSVTHSLIVRGSYQKQQIIIASSLNNNDNDNNNNNDDDDMGLSSFTYTQTILTYGNPSARVFQKQKKKQASRSVERLVHWMTVRRWETKRERDAWAKQQKRRRQQRQHIHSNVYIHKKTKERKEERR